MGDVGQVDLAVGVLLVPGRDEGVDHRCVAARALPHLQLAAAAAATAACRPTSWRPRCRRSWLPGRRSPPPPARRSPVRRRRRRRRPHTRPATPRRARAHTAPDGPSWDPPDRNCLTVLKWYAVNAMLSSECDEPSRRGRMTADRRGRGGRPWGRRSTTGRRTATTLPVAPSRCRTSPDASGVSQSTVSRVLNDAATTVPIAAVTRERVLEAADRLGYRPNPLARGLRGSKTMLLGIIVREISDPFFATAVEAVSLRARERGYNVVLGSAHSDAHEAIELHAVLETRHCDAIIVLGDMRDQPRLLDDLSRLEGPRRRPVDRQHARRHRHRQRRQPRRRRHGHRPSPRPRSPPHRVHRREPARRRPRARGGVRRAPHRARGGRRRGPHRSRRDRPGRRRRRLPPAVQRPAPADRGGHGDGQPRHRRAPRRLRPAAGDPRAGVGRRVRRHPARRVRRPAVDDRPQPGERDGQPRRRPRHRPPVAGARPPPPRPELHRAGDDRTRPG